MANATDTPVLDAPPAPDADHQHLRASLETITRAAARLLTEIQALRDRVDALPPPEPAAGWAAMDWAATDLVLVEEEGVLSDRDRDRLRGALEKVARGAGAVSLRFGPPRPLELARESA